MSLNPEDRLWGHLSFLYGDEKAGEIWTQLRRILESFQQRHPHLAEKSIQLNERDAILITYGDQVREQGRPPLQTLALFLETHLQDAINGVHLLPFYPYSSDDGFSVIDYRQVDPELGNWEDVANLGKNFRLMFDAVVNHISRQSSWFAAFQRGEEPFRDYFITVDPQTDLSSVVRPRALPLLTPVETSWGVLHVWTTFSDDQIDLNYGNPQVLLEMVDLLLFYVERGAEIIRLDAIAYLWKEIGTPSIHLPETHAVVKLFRAVLDAVAPHVVLITETNVPHPENISYFGEPLPANGQDQESLRGDEAQLVYQFPLAPLVLHTFHTQDARLLSEWASGLQVPFPGVTFFNFIASHDGIGVRPAEGLLSPAEIQVLVERIHAHGGHVSYRSNPDGSQSAYELNITLYDALNDPGDPQQERDVRRYLASQAIMLSLPGVPGIYFHSLFGSPNCHACVENTGRARSINREKLELSALEAALANPQSRTASVFRGYAQILQARRNQPAFHPFSPHQILSLHPQIFAILRNTLDGEDTVLCLINVSSEILNLAIATGLLELPQTREWIDLINGDTFPVQGDSLALHLESYQYRWLSPGKVKH